MIERLYIHNFRCLENFELPVRALPSALLIGRNGAGKSSIGMALGILQKIARGDNRIRDLITPEDMTRGHDDIPVRFELEATISGVRYAYALALELPPGFRELRVQEESLTVDGMPKYTRDVAELQLPKPDGQMSTMSFDWHRIWLSVAQARSEQDPLEIFRKWLSRMLILRPICANLRVF